MSELYKALQEFWKITPLVKASKENPYFKSKYADYNDVVSETREDLEKCGLMVKQTVSHIDTKTAIRTKLIHLESGEVLEDVAPVESAPNNPQTQGSGITYMKRYSYIAMLDLLVDIDDDGNLERKLKERTDKESADLATAEKTLRACKTLGELKEKYIEILKANPKLSRDLVGVKDEIKAKLGGDK